MNFILMGVCVWLVLKLECSFWLVVFRGTRTVWVPPFGDKSKSLLQDGVYLVQTSCKNAAERGGILLLTRLSESQGAGYVKWGRRVGYSIVFGNQP